jgi:hypothetical protein
MSFYGLKSFFIYYAALKIDNLFTTIPLKASHSLCKCDMYY